MGKRLVKEIEIVSPETMKNQKVYRSYRAVAIDLKVGENVTVGVREGFSGDGLKIFVGYGEVEKIDENSWYEPRRLVPEF